MNKELLQQAKPTLEQLEELAASMVAREELNWLGFRKDLDGRYTIPTISTSEYKLVLEALKEFAQPARKNSETSRDAAVATLMGLGYTYWGAEQWEPPVTQPKSEWRDIASAPKNKSSMLVVVNGEVEIGYHYSNKWFYEKDFNPILDAPTHWMHLPAAPKETK